MSDVDRYYEATYALPTCEKCGGELTYNTYKVYEVELFCGNEICPAFVKTFWIKKKDLTIR
jgi:hypothetical protein